MNWTPFVCTSCRFSSNSTDVTKTWHKDDTVIIIVVVRCQPRSLFLFLLFFFFFVYVLCLCVFVIPIAWVEVDNQRRLALVLAMLCPSNFTQHHNNNNTTLKLASKDTRFHQFTWTRRQRRLARTATPHFFSQCHHHHPWFSLVCVYLCITQFTWPCAYSCKRQ